MKIINLLAFISSILINLTIQTLLKKSLIKKNFLTTKNTDYKEDKAKLWANYLMGISCAKKPLKKTCNNCLKPSDGNKFAHFFLSKRSKLPFKLLVHYNDIKQTIYLFFSGPIFNKSNIEYFNRHFLSNNHLKQTNDYEGCKINSEIYRVYFSKIKKKVFKTLEKLIKSNRDQFSLVFVGNSVAGSLATLAAYDVKTNFNKSKNFKEFEVYAFNAFNFAEDKFNQKLKNSKIKFFRIFKENDFIISPNCSYDVSNSKWKCSQKQPENTLKASNLNNTNLNNNNNNLTLNNSSISIKSNKNNKNNTQAANRSFRLDEENIILLERNFAFELIDESRIDKEYFNDMNDFSEESSEEYDMEEEYAFQVNNNTLYSNSTNKNRTVKGNYTLNMKNLSNSTSNLTKFPKLISKNKLHNINSNNNSIAVLGKNNKGNLTHRLIAGSNNTKLNNTNITNSNVNRLVQPNNLNNNLVIRLDNKINKNVTIQINFDSNKLKNIITTNFTNGIIINKNNSKTLIKNGKKNQTRFKGLILNGNRSYIDMKGLILNKNQTGNNSIINNKNVNKTFKSNNTYFNQAKNNKNNSAFNMKKNFSNHSKHNNRMKKKKKNIKNNNTNIISNSPALNKTSNKNQTNIGNLDLKNSSKINTDKNNKNNHNSKKSKSKKNRDANKHKNNKHNDNHKKIEQYKKQGNSAVNKTMNISINDKTDNKYKCYANSVKTEAGTVILRVDPGVYGEVIVYNKEMNKFVTCTPEQDSDKECKRCIINLVLEKSIKNYSHLDLFGKKLDSCKH